MGEMVWFTLTSGIGELGQYRAKNLVWCYDQWLVGDPTTGNIGYLTESISSHWDELITWQFGTSIAYNESNSVIFHELVALTGRVALGKDPMISTQYSVDGETWSQERSIKSGKQGDRSKRLVWLSQGSMRNFRTQRFCGTSDSHLTFARLEIRLEAMAF